MVVKHSMNIKFAHFGEKRVRVICKVESYPFLINAKCLEHKVIFHIVTCHLQCSCQVTRETKCINSDRITKGFLQDFRKKS